MPSIVMIAALCSLLHRVALFGEEARALQVVDEAPDEVRPSLFAREIFSLPDCNSRGGSRTAKVKNGAE